MEIPPYFKTNGTGAHISIISAEEAKKYNLFNIDDIGRKATFDISYFTNLHPMGFKGVDNLSLVGINSTALERIRQKHSLSAKIFGSHDFHITTGVKYKNV